MSRVREYRQSRKQHASESHLSIWSARIGHIMELRHVSTGGQMTTMRDIWGVLDQ